MAEAEDEMGYEGEGEYEDEYEGEGEYEGEREYGYEAAQAAVAPVAARGAAGRWTRRGRHIVLHGV
jgi:hypothetical protein